MVLHKGLEPLTPSLRVTCSTNWANGAIQRKLYNFFVVLFFYFNNELNYNPHWAAIEIVSQGNEVSLYLTVILELLALTITFSIES